MKYYFLLLFVLPTWALYAQPLNGSYTVGGTSPNFTTLQAAANAVKARGVSGPVWFNIRPGIYIENGGLNPVMVLDSVVAGASPANRITFQPDQNLGGNVGNTRLQINQTTQTSTALVRIKVDYVTIRNLTLEDVDSAEAGADFLLHIDQHTFGEISRGIVIEGCRFFGNSNHGGGAIYGTDYGIYGSTNVADIVIRQNTFQRLMRSVEIGGTAGSNGSVIVEDNQFLNAHNHGDAWGTWIKVSAYRTIVRRNYLDNAGGRGSIYGIVVQADSGLIERNTIKYGGGSSSQVPTFRAIIVNKRLFSSRALSMLIVNNMISGSTSVGGWGSPIMGRYGIIANTKAQIIHNTIVHPYREQISVGIFLDNGSDSSTVVNNIVVDYGSPNGLPLVEPIVVFKQFAGLSGLVSDYNVFFYNQLGVYLAAVGSNRYTTLSAYRAATGLDSNSIGKDVEFAGGDRYPHLSDCQAQDPQLIGIPYPGIVNDVDGDPRSLTAPTRGADEGRMRTTRMFGDVFRAHIPSNTDWYYLGVAAGKFDNLLVDGLAVTDYPNKQIRLYHNVPSSRSFYLSGTLPLFNLGPFDVKFLDLDHDGNLDVIAGGDTNIVKVFWGDGGGGFPQSTTVPTRKWVRSIDTGRVSFLNLRTVVLTEGTGILPTIYFLGYLYNGNGRNLEHYTVIRPRPGGGTEPDTLFHFPYDMAIGDLDGNGSHEIAAAMSSLSQPFWVFVDTTFGNLSWGHHNMYPIPVGSSIVPGRFTGGPLKDIIAPGPSIPQHTYTLLRNLGGLSFSPDTVVLSGPQPHKLAAMDYDNDGDLDFVSANGLLASHGVSVFLNDGAGHFTEELNCYPGIGRGGETPTLTANVVASDFDLDGKTDLAIVTRDSLFVLYNFGNVTGVGTDPVFMPTEFSLEQNYPNPFNPTTTIKLDIPKTSNVTLKVFDLLGREVATLVNETTLPGSHTIRWDASSFASGVYFYRLQAEGLSLTRKMLLVR